MRLPRKTLAVSLGALFCVTLLQAGQVAIYTGATNWISQQDAQAQAEILSARLQAAGVSEVVIFSTPADDVALAEWVEMVTGNGEVDVLVLYGFLPSSLYPAGNTMPDGSPIENLIESTDGDAVLNQADYMFYVSDPINGPTALQNIMDIPGITMGDDDTPMTVTDDGRKIAPTLSDFLSDRPFHLDQLSGEWFAEAVLAQDSTGTRADPCIVRDGDRGRLIIAYQTNSQADPKGAVAAEIIAHVLGLQLQPTKIGLSGFDTTVAGTRVKLTLSLWDDAGIPTPSPNAVTVNLSTTSGTGAFDTQWAGSYDGSITSVQIPAGALRTTLYYKDTSAGTVTLSASGGGFEAAQFDLQVLEDLSGEPGEIAIYTGNVNWIDPAAAEAEAQACVDALEALGITDYVWFRSPAEAVDLADWVSAATDNGKLDILILYGYLPDTIYPAGNTSPDDSVAELFIESTDGDMILNHADYMFYVSSTNNAAAGLQNIMDNPVITMWGDNTPMTPTAEGRKIAPSLMPFLSDRPFHIDELTDQWFVEAALGLDATGTRADPVIVRDGNRGRLAIAFQTAAQNDPKGLIAAEIIAWLYGFDISIPDHLEISGRAVGLTGRPVRLTVEVKGVIGNPVFVDSPTTINLLSSSATGAFDISATGSFDGSVTSVTIPAGESSAEFFYRDTAGGTPVITAKLAGVTDGTLQLTIFEVTPSEPGEVAIYTGSTWWITKAEADAQAQICARRLEAAGIPTTIFSSSAEAADLANWVEDATDNGHVDVLILFGMLPAELYAGNLEQPDGSIVELFIESEDGDAVLNHADWMFYDNGRNGPGGLQNIMDIPDIVFGADDTPMFVTEEGKQIAPHLEDFLSDRPMLLNMLQGDWLPEVILAQSADGTQADPVIVRDGNRGRLIPVFQTNAQNDPKGAVAAEIIAYLMDKELQPMQPSLNLQGSSVTVTGTPLRLTLRLFDEAGFVIPFPEATTVTLETNPAAGAFDTVWDGAYDGSVASITVPAGETSAVLYYKSELPVEVTISATAPGVTAAQLQVRVLQDQPVSQGEVAIYTGAVNWIDQAAAEAQAQICVQALDDQGIPNTWFRTTAEDLDLADWVAAATDNGQLDVLVLYGYVPDSIYPAGNGSPDGSIAELFIESTDGDAIMNHADYMFFVSSTNNDVAGLQNIMDIPGISMWGDDTAMTVTYEGSKIAPSLQDFFSDRPFHLGELTGDWFLEAALAIDSSGTLSDPCIVRDGNRGRLIPVFQANAQNDPKGAVAAEIISWLMPSAGGEPRFMRGDSNADGTVNIADAIYVLGFLFGGEEPPPCRDAGDANDDGAINIADAIATLGHLFGGEGNLPAPFGVCGTDPTGDGLDCQSFPPCSPQ